MISPTIHFINPSRESNKNSHSAFSNIQTLEHFVNFGIYSIIQELKGNCIPTVFHDFQKKYHVQLLKEKLCENSVNLFGVSIISAFNASSGSRILKDIKSINKSNITVLGGQHYIGQLKNKAFEIFPESDIIVSGEGENAMLLIAKQWHQHGGNLPDWDKSQLTKSTRIRLDKEIVRGTLCNNLININKIENYTYKDYPNIKTLFPSVEYSRGCPFCCTFCVNTKSNMKNFRYRDISSLRKSILDLFDIFEKKPLRFYLQASNFIINQNEIDRFREGLFSLKDDIEWRTELRVDTIDERYFEKLYDVGLRVIDIGLDSASPDVLEVMRKTSNPDSYLKKATILLKAATEAGVFTKINFLIHPGDNLSTLAISKNWLIQNKQFISAISIWPALLFPGSQLEQNFEYYHNKFGATICQNSPLSKWGVFEMNPSSEINQEISLLFSREISQIINTRKNYAFAKSFGYYGHNVSRSDLLEKFPTKNSNHTVPYYDN